MKKLYQYNLTSCHYEPVRFSWGRFLKRASVFTLLALCAALISFFWYNQRFSPLQEQYLNELNASLKIKWKSLEQRITSAKTSLDELALHDDQNYRLILDLPALSTNERQAGTGGAEVSYPPDALAHPLIANTFKTLEKLRHQVDVETQSIAKLLETAEMRQAMWASRPAIQPIYNKKLSRLHTSYGLRLHPIFNTVMDHKGLDFSAPRGTPVYASGDGRVSMAYSSGSYGNVVYIDHGFDFETRYAHLFKFNVRAGEYVKRGQIIGYVGNTGVSAAPHLHYEVLYKGAHVNPINFFQRDLSNSEYEKLIRISSEARASLD
jgi:murein DD-endopeptidase MepM/ murein hydrolase activator NlpD